MVTIWSLTKLKNECYCPAQKIKNICRHNANRENSINLGLLHVVNKLNFELNDIIYRSSSNYDSNFNNEINNKFDNINKLFIQNKKMNKDIFISLNKNIDELINSIVDAFDDEKSLKLKHYKYNNSNLFNQFKKYNEINDIIKTLEVMN